MSSSVIFRCVIVFATVSLALCATCTYRRSSNQVTCGSVTCSAENPSYSSKLPAGTYRVGVERTHHGVPWFNLYRRIVNSGSYGSGYWDYFTKVPEAGCRGGFGLHAGTVSAGCITVRSRSCFGRLAAAVSRFSSKSFTVRECRRCLFSRCLGGTGNLSRTYTTDLRAI